MNGAAAAHEHPHEIIIVRHGGGDHEDAHHGGVWKIAFADFMTAMMCFFLVMWLINAANEQTRAAVASYFNPVKLIDRNSSRKGLEDIGDGPAAVGFETDNPISNDGKAGTAGPLMGGPRQVRNSQDEADAEKFSDEHLFAEPYAVLAEIVGDTGNLQNISSKGDGGTRDAGPATGASGGEAYRDPFAPDFWTSKADQPVETEPSLEGPAAEPDIGMVFDGDGATTAKREPQGASKPEETARVEEAPNPDAALKPEENKVDAGKAEVATAKDAAEPEELKKPEEAEAKPDQKDGRPTDAAIAKAKEIKQELVKAMGSGDKLDSGLEVVATDKGVTISVTDEFDFGMFEVGSAVPRRELVLAMEKIGKVLSSQTGAITIDGHTDARQFRTAAYDNWRLSTARAHSAYYMLVRAGLDEKRIDEVAGFADRKLKLKDKPLDAANRRIEILLEVQE